MINPFKIICSTKLIANDFEKEFAINYLKEYVDKNKGYDITTTSDSLVFKVSIFGWSWDIFSQIEKGIFKLDNNALIFEGSMYRIFFCFALVCLMVCFETRDIDTIAFLFVGPCVLNWVIASVRYKTLVETLTKEIFAQYQKKFPEKLNP